MSGSGMFKSVIKEYGIEWAVNRFLYSAKVKMVSTVAGTEKIFEKKTSYPKRLNLFRIDVEKLRTYIQDISDVDKAELIETADKACEGIITAFSSVELDYGSPIDWQFNPLTGKRCDEKRKWHRIPDFDKERGDIKVIWEASRFSHFIIFARAYLLTEDKKYYRAFSEQLRSWLTNNPYSYGANFKCGQECSLRMVNTLLAFTVFKDCGVATDADASNVKDLIDRCYRKVISNFFYAYKCIKNNHTLSEIMGMIVGAWCSEDDKQVEKTFNLLDEVIDEQFTDDGGYRQFSFNYQRLALQVLECVMSIEERVGKQLSQNSKNKIKNAALLMYQCQDESGDMPNYGSNDGALVFPVTSCSYRDFQPVINTAYALTTGQQLYKEGKYQEELLWFSGGRDLARYRTGSVERTSSQFPYAGLFTIRGSTSWVMVVSNDYHSRPAHMDQLHLDLWVNGINVLCDAGTYSYAGDLGRELVKNVNHNTVVAGSVLQMNMNGPFLIYDWTKRKVGECGENCVEGKIASANGYTHIRKIKYIGASYMITDKVNKDNSILFHTPCKVGLKNGEAVLSNDGKELCRIRSSSKIYLQESLRSLYYLEKQETTCLIIKGKADTVIKTIVEITGGEQETW